MAGAGHDAPEQERANRAEKPAFVDSSAIASSRPTMKSAQLAGGVAVEPLNQRRHRHERHDEHGRHDRRQPEDGLQQRAGGHAADVCMTLSSVSITTATKSSSAVTVSAVWPKMLCRALFSRRVFPIMAVLETISMPARPGRKRAASPAVTPAAGCR